MDLVFAQFIQPSPEHIEPILFHYYKNKTVYPIHN